MNDSADRGVPISARQGVHLKLPPRQLAFLGAGLIGLVALLAYGYHWWTVGRFIQSTDDAYVGADVTVLAPKVAGFIADVAVTDNQSVRAGDLLVKLDDRDYRAALARADATVAGPGGDACQP
jgi:membrane fusion protein, multidrug efflux system